MCTGTMQLVLHNLCQSDAVPVSIHGIFCVAEVLPCAVSPIFSVLLVTKVVQWTLYLEYMSVQCFLY